MNGCHKQEEYLNFPRQPGRNALPHAVAAGRGGGARVIRWAAVGGAGGVVQVLQRKSCQQLKKKESVEQQHQIKEDGCKEIKWTEHGEPHNKKNKREEYLQHWQLQTVLEMHR